MADYRPPFTITNGMVKLVSEISVKIGRLDRYRELDTRPHLRRNNRIRSIHSSLAIEANELSLDAVRGVIDGRAVVGPQKEIQEVKNAYKAYDQVDRFDPFSIDALKRLHGVMTDLTIAESGEFRRGEEGVFDGSRCIFMAPPAKRVPSLMEDLFSWMNREKEDLHPLILSSVFHDEFVFIHPFADGNGRMARLWQTGILCAWNPIFQYLPIESQIHAFQPEYYEAIATCHREGQSNSFVLFMLEKIDETLDMVFRQTDSSDSIIGQYVKRLLDAMEYDVPYSANRIMELLHLKSRETLRKNYINPALEMGLIIMSNPDKPTSRNQTYMKR